MTISNILDLGYYPTNKIPMSHHESYCVRFLKEGRPAIWAEFETVQAAAYAENLIFDKEFAEYKLKNRAMHYKVEIRV